MTRNHRRIGFTLVELLVVIAIIGVLVAITIPAVNVARKSAQRVTCSNHLRQLGIATTAYESSKGKYPAAVSTPNANTTYNWVVTLLPSLDQQVLFDSLENEVRLGNNAMLILPQQGYLKIMNCPSDPYKNYEGPEGSYAANMGVIDDLANAVLDSPDLGLFHNRSDAFPARQHVKLSRDDINDGASYTIMYSENSNTLGWGPFGFDDPDTSTLDERTAYVDSYEIANGLVFVNTQEPANVSINFGNCAQVHGNSFNPWRVKPVDIDCWKGSTYNEKYSFSRPSSYHTQGFNAVFAGNEVRFISNTIDYGVYQRMMTPDGLNLDPMAWPYATGGVQDNEIE